MPPEGFELALNPSARIEVCGEGLASAFLVRAPIRASVLSSVLVEASNFPDAHAYLQSTLIAGQSDAPLSAQGLDELLRIGLFAPRDALPRMVEYKMPALPELGPLARAALLSPSEPEAADDWAPPDLLLLPEYWQALVFGFAKHPPGAVWAPVGQSVPLLSASTKATPSAGAAGRQAVPLWDSTATRQRFFREGFVELPDLLPMAHVLALGKYFGELAAEGYLERDDGGSTRRFIAHNHPVARFWHLQLNARVSRLIGSPTKPSYSFVSVYEAGGDLSWHIDRAPCAYTITLLVDYAPLTEDQRSPWALNIRARDGSVYQVQQRLGEALIFQGRELKHGRERLPDGHRSTSILFHFVDQDYDGVMA